MFLHISVSWCYWIFNLKSLVRHVICWTMCQELSLRMLGRPKGVRGYHCQSTYSNLSIPWWFALIPGTIGYSLPHSHGRKNMVVNRGDWHVRQSISTIPLPYPYHTIPILEPTYNPMNWKMYIYNTYITHTHTHIYIYILYIYIHTGDVNCMRNPS